ncbi:hypothetical protein D3C77_336910 [compost metagenome]
MCDLEWERTRLTKLKAIIDALDDAILQLSTTAILEYHLDTGQSKQRVTRQDLPRLVDAKADLFTQYDALCARLSNGGALQVIPGALP